jgi:DNA repair protein RadC
LKHRDIDLSDMELLTLIIASIDSRVNAASLARTLVHQFGTARGVFRADPGSLAAVDGMTRRCAALLRFIEQIYMHVLKTGLVGRELLADDEALQAYLVERLSAPAVEEFCVVYLDRRMQLIGDDIIFRGTFDACLVYPREIIKRTLNAGADTIILAHNHPSRARTPSRDDARVTQEVIRVARPLNIRVHDHYIIAGEDCISMRAAGYFPGDN